MKVVYSSRAFTDLDRILAWYSANASQAIAKSNEQRLDAVVDRICLAPESAPRLARRSQVRVFALVHYPFRIFYRINEAPSIFCIFDIRQDGRSQDHNERRLWHGPGVSRSEHVRDALNRENAAPRPGHEAYAAVQPPSIE